MAARITVIGSFVMDEVVKTDVFPAAGQTVLGRSLELFPGGKGANQCVSVSRLGGNAVMVGMLGRDENGERFRRILRREKIDESFVFSCNLPTAVAQVQIDATGQNRICVIPSANYAFSEEQVDLIDRLLKNSGLVVLQLELRLNVVEEIIRRAHGYGTKILLNPAPAIKLSRKLLGQVDYLTPNETELAILSEMPVGTDDEICRAVEKLHRDGAKVVVVTLGSRGAYVSDGGTYAEFVPGFEVKVVDTVAAGDSFNGAFAVALTEGKMLREAVRFANAMGALTVQSKGAIPSLRTREDVEYFLQQNR